MFNDDDKDDDRNKCSLFLGNQILKYFFLPL